MRYGTRPLSLRNDGILQSWCQFCRHAQKEMVSNVSDDLPN